MHQTFAILGTFSQENLGIVCDKSSWDSYY